MFQRHARSNGGSLEKYFQYKSHFSRINKINQEKEELKNAFIVQTENKYKNRI